MTTRSARDFILSQIPDPGSYIHRTKLIKAAQRVGVSPANLERALDNLIRLGHIGTAQSQCNQWFYVRQDLPPQINVTNSRWATRPYELRPAAASPRAASWPGTPDERAVSAEEAWLEAEFSRSVRG
jgi:hypothetical protein